MNPLLPTINDLEKLPLRAVVTYSARTTRRLSSVLRGIVADDVLDDVLRLVESVSKLDDISRVHKHPIAVAAQRVTEAYANSPGDLKSAERFLVVFSMLHTAYAAISAIEAATTPACALDSLKSAAKDAEQAVRHVRVLGGHAAFTAAEAARRDYEVLLRAYGERSDDVIGKPVDCF